MAVCGRRMIDVELTRADHDPMGIEQLFSPADVALLFDWLRESGELYLDLDRPHSGGSNNSVHFIGSLPALKSIISREEHPGNLDSHLPAGAVPHSRDRGAELRGPPQN